MVVAPFGTLLEDDDNGAVAPPPSRPPPASRRRKVVLEDDDDFLNMMPAWVVTDILDDAKEVSAAPLNS